MLSWLTLGRPSPRTGRIGRVCGGTGIRLLLIGCFEGLSPERGIAWRVSDSRSLRSLLNLDVTEAAPDHSMSSRTQLRTDEDTHEAMPEPFVGRRRGDRRQYGPDG